MKMSRTGSNSDIHQVEEAADHGSESPRSIVRENENLEEGEITDQYGFFGGLQFSNPSDNDSDIPPEVTRQREIKWIEMLDKWDHFIRKDFTKVKSRCRKGIPRSIRGRAWLHLCGGAFLKKRYKGIYTHLLTRQADPQCVEDIRKDLHRTFPQHEIFTEDGLGKEDLFDVLRAYSVFNPRDNYCQAHSPIAATLLMHMPAEDAFWCLVAICDKYLSGYFSPGMETLVIDGRVLYGLLKKYAPAVYKHFEAQNIAPLCYMTDWFSCVFVRVLPWPTVLRIWDMFLCEGVKVTLRVGLVLLKYTFSKPSILEACPSDIETLIQLKNFPKYIVEASWLSTKIATMKITKDQMKKEHFQQLLIMRRQKESQRRAIEQRQFRAAIRVPTVPAPALQT